MLFKEGEKKVIGSGFISGACLFVSLLFSDVFVLKDIILYFKRSHRGKSAEIVYFIIGLQQTLVSIIA